MTKRVGVMGNKKAAFIGQPCEVLVRIGLYVFRCPGGFILANQDDEKAYQDEGN